MYSESENKFRRDSTDLLFSRFRKAKLRDLFSNNGFGNHGSRLDGGNVSSKNNNNISGADNSNVGKVCDNTCRL